MTHQMQHFQNLRLNLLNDRLQRDKHRPTSNRDALDIHLLHLHNSTHHYLLDLSILHNHRDNQTN